MKAVSGLMLALLFVGMLTWAFNIQLVEAGGTIYIRADGSVEPDTAPVSSVDNITYTFTANINDEIVIQRNNIVVDGFGHIVQGTGNGTGIDLSSINNVTIKNIRIKAFNYGISLVDSSNNTIYGNTITENDYYGIHIGSGSSNNTISGNNIENNDNGIVLYYSSNNILQSNLLDGNQFGFGFLGLELSHFLHSIDSSNLVDGKPVYYLIDQHDITINPSTHPQVGFLALISSTNVTVEGLTMTKNRLGLLIVYTNNTRIQNNNMTNNVRGIWLYDSSNNTISGNSIRMNSGGIVLYGSSNNIIYHNNFINNTNQVDSYNSTNIWDDGYPSGGNYWSDYEVRYPNATEIDNSGLWDTPYVIDAENLDNYPVIPEFPTWTSMLLILIMLTFAIAITKRRLLKTPIH